MTASKMEAAFRVWTAGGFKAVNTLLRQPDSQYLQEEQGKSFFGNAADLEIVMRGMKGRICQLPSSGEPFTIAAGGFHSLLAEVYRRCW